MKAALSSQRYLTPEFPKESNLSTVKSDESCDESFVNDDGG